MFHLHLTSSSVVYLQQQQKSANIFYFGFPASAGYSPPLHLFFNCRTYPCILKPNPLFFFSFPLLVCCQQSNFCYEALGTHIPHASHDCHALRYYSGAHGGGVPMPLSASAPTNAWCVILGGWLLWKGNSAALFTAELPTDIELQSPP